MLLLSLWLGWLHWFGHGRWHTLGWTKDDGLGGLGLQRCKIDDELLPIAIVCITSPTWLSLLLLHRGHSMIWLNGLRCLYLHLVLLRLLRSRRLTSACWLVEIRSGGGASWLVVLDGSIPANVMHILIELSLSTRF